MVRGLLPWAGFLAMVWWVLEPDPGAWVAGVGAVTLGVLLRLYAGRLQPVGIRPVRLAGFVPYFLGQSILGGWDVSRRALSPKLPLSPRVMTYRSTLGSTAARVFFSNALSLLPGTFAADLREDVFVVHLLVGSVAAEARVRELEARVAHLFEIPDA
jgi:multicomponent Na+:H+ antiporter subunit E